ncbi:3-deoxy-D-manno-octulosonic acid transferase [Mucilaginibacter lacusdianchii]|uniref:3-deoxy-D-manno-octulosonic acid transferase n=1 Tax=Mucilaginibacter lacusdianchii TaxID=2684211 RepID=UPI00131BA8DE|nr:glycosyltransferase N-terminal domain-containing protein [Mucilaginibacter sp. JXJ CY 39]
MLILYNFGIWLYRFIIIIASAFNVKAKKWLSGRRTQNIHKTIDCIWFHFASLGEFEQGRPVLEAIRAHYPNQKIIITFFSPSGFEIRKNTPLADAVYYLPLDTAANAREFINAIQPRFAVFTKYEYWYHFYKELHNRQIPLYVISAIFRPNQIFFKWYGGLHRRMLTYVTHLFVQDESSKSLLQSININRVTISGDTRFDRVWANAQQPKELPIIAQFKNNQPLLVAGSTWPPDEELIAQLAVFYPDWKFVIAPHEIGADKINRLASLLPADKIVQFSQIATLNRPLEYYQILIIDNIGMLSSLYQYGNIAYIGGGFGTGIHNTLEAAAFGIPVVFGPNYEKFKEAKDLIALQAGFTINSQQELDLVIEKLISDDSFCKGAGAKAGQYVDEHQGATAVIMEELKR